ncbi:Transcription factor TCP20 [Platanthera zijinensis]|uniref:Transcription factor TCP20 n=1 Tax=Platanthera zijinensis TaxID=2320716 RepID=A0AAP0AW79_9ASPA
MDPRGSSEQDKGEARRELQIVISSTSEREFPLVASSTPEKDDQKKLLAGHPSTSAGLHPKLSDHPSSGSAAASRPNWAAGLWPPPVPSFGSHGFLPNLAGNNEGPAGGGFMQRIGLPGLELPAANLGQMSFASLLGGHGQQIPGLELALSQDGQIGVLNPYTLNQFYLHMGQGRGGPADEQLQQQQQQQQQQQSQGSLNKDDSDGSTQ